VCPRSLNPIMRKRLAAGCMIPPAPEPETQNQKHGFLCKQWSRRSILLGLGIHFSLWWGLSVWYWMSYWNMHWSWAAWYPLIAPVEFGFLYLQPDDVRLFGVAGLLASGCLLGLTVLSAIKRKRWAVLLAHISVVLYWFSSFLIAATWI